MTRRFRLRLPGAFLLGLLAGALGHSLYVRPRSAPIPETAEGCYARLITVSPAVTEERIMTVLTPMPR
jgi:hypothetical protein